MSKINGIWDNPYVCEMGIQYHCNELIVLNNLFLEAKAINDEQDVTNTVLTMKREICDLYLILEKYLDVCSLQNLVKERIAKFTEKQQEDIAYLKEVYK